MQEISDYGVWRQARNSTIERQDNEDPLMAISTHDDLARRLRDAYSGGVIAPLRDGLDPVDADGAYAVQTINTRFWAAQGRLIVGRKAGLTAKAVQMQLGVDQPDFGVLFDDMRVADSGRLDPSRCIQAKAEAEIAFVLGADLPSTSSTPAEVAAAAVSYTHLTLPTM
jgi:2-keto-4-pentenoate hydratase